MDTTHQANLDSLVEFSNTLLIRISITEIHVEMTQTE